MRLQPPALDRQASFGITSSIDDGKPVANTLQSCSFALYVDHISMHILGAHLGCTRRNHIASSGEGMRFRHRCALERTARHFGCIPSRLIEIESLTTDARSCLGLQGVIANAVIVSNPENNSCRASISSPGRCSKL